MEDVVRLVLNAEVEGLAGITRKLQAAAQGFSLDFSEVIKDISLMSKKVLTGALKDGSRKAMRFMRSNIYQSSVEGVGSAMEKGTGILTKGLQDAKGSFQGLVSGIFKGVGESGEKYGQKLDKYGKKLLATQKKGIVGGGVKALGVTVRILGSIAGTLGVVVSSFSALIGMIMDAEAQVKEMNSAIVSGGIAGGDLASQLWEVGAAMDVIRESAVDIENNWKWGTLAKDQIEILGAFNEAGFTLRDMTKDVTDASTAIRDYQDVTRVALTYAKLLGMTAQEMATQQAEYMESLGGSLQFVEQQFAAVYKSAQLSGFGVKRFYSMVQQATSGMAMYNVRLDEAAGLLVRLGQILGSRVAGDFLQELSKGFVDESMTDRFKRVMTTGSGTMKTIFENTADDVAFAFHNKLKALPDGIGKDVEAILKEANLNIDFSTEEGRKELVGQLAKMDPDAATKLLAQIRMVDEGTAREMSKLIDVSEGTTGNLGDMAKAMGSLDMGGTLAAKLASANAIIGKPLHKMSAMQLAAFENITGISGEQREILMEVSRGLTGNYQVLEDSKKSVEELNAKTDAESQKKLEALQVAQLKATGAFVRVEAGVTEIATAVLDESDHIVGGTEKAIDNMGEYIQSQGDSIAAVTEKAMDKNTALAQAVARNTTSMATILEIGVHQALEKIYGVVVALSSFFMGKGEDAVTPKERKKEIKDAQNLERKFNSERGKVEQELAQKKIDLDEATGEKKQELEKEVADLQAKSANLGVKAGMQRLKQVELSGATSRGEFDQAKAGTLEQFLAGVAEVKGEEEAQKYRDRMSAEVDRRGGAAAGVEKALMDEVSSKLNASLESTQDLGSIVEGALTGKAVTAAAAEAKPVAAERGYFDKLETVILGWVPFRNTTAEDTEEAQEKQLKALRLFESSFREVGNIFFRQGDAQKLAKDTASGGWDSSFGGPDAEVLKELSPEETIAQFKEYLQKMNPGGNVDYAEMAADLGTTEEKLLISLANQGQAQFASVYQDGNGSLVVAEEKTQELLQTKLDDLIVAANDARIADGKAGKLELSEEWKQKKKQAVDIAKELNRMEEKQAVYKRLAEMGYDEGEIPAGVMDAIDKAFSEGSYGSYGAQRSLARKGLLSDKGTALVLGKPEAKDFVFRPGQDPLLFSPNDTLVGMKTGGPIEKALLGKLEGRMSKANDFLSSPGKDPLLFKSGGTLPEAKKSVEPKVPGSEAAPQKRGVTINIYGSQAEVYKTVKRVLSETGTL